MVRDDLPFVVTYERKDRSMTDLDIAAVHKSITVDIPQTRAFEVFTA